MSSFKKMLAVMLALGVFTPALAFADTGTSTASTLISQIQSLQQQQQAAMAQLVSLLKQGSSGDQVATLQALLAADPSIYPEGIISGKFGRLTSEAVKRFQKKNGLDQVGSVGPKTLKKLQEYLRDHPLGFTTASSTALSANGREGGGGEHRPCAIVPPGQTIALGWAKKHEGEGRQIVAPCQTGSGEREDDDHRVRVGSTTPPAVVADVTAPLISGITVTGISSTTALVSWATNENATSKIYFSSATPFSLATAFTSGTSVLSTSHGMNLASLMASTTYAYVLVSKDAANNTATSSTQSFTTLAL